jgi:hypothetical protein
MIMWRALSVRIVLVALVALASGCGDGDEVARWVGQVREASVEADRAIAEGDVEAARAALVGLVEAETPRGVAPDDRRVVVADAAYRLAELALSERDAEAALRWADRGLAQGRPPDLFTANLLVARGRALEALGRDVDAAAEYHAALLINEVLLQEALGAAAGREVE